MSLEKGRSPLEGKGEGPDGGVGGGRCGAAGLGVAYGNGLLWIVSVQRGWGGLGIFF